MAFDMVGLSINKITVMRKLSGLKIYEQIEKYSATFLLT